MFSDPKRRPWENLRVIFLLFAGVTIAASAHKLAMGKADVYLTFIGGFWNLVSGHDLYGAHPEAWRNGFKYPPFFALVMAPFAVLPVWAGAMLWNLVNLAALFVAIAALDLEPRRRAAMLWIVSLELLTSLQNFQANALIAALIIGAFVSGERERPWSAALCVAGNAFLKVFGGVAGIFAMMRPHRLRFLAALTFCTAIFALAPLAFTLQAHGPFVYRRWLETLGADHSAPLPMSLVNALRVWLHLEIAPIHLQLAGLVFLCLPLLRVRRFSDAIFRHRMLASTLLWCVLFNHMAESPAFVIAVSGVAIWFAISPAARWRTVLLALVILVTSLGSTDLFPRAVREHVVRAFVLKPLPCLLVWLVLQWELLAPARTRTDTAGLHVR